MKSTAILALRLSRSHLTSYTKAVVIGACFAQTLSSTTLENSTLLLALLQRQGFYMNNRSHAYQTIQRSGIQLNCSRVDNFSPCPRFFSVHRVDRFNVGDLISAPYLYFPELSAVTEGRILDIETSRFDHDFFDSDVVVIGGGGLVRDREHPWSTKIVKICLKARCVGWGLGLNFHKDSLLNYPGYARTESHGGVFKSLGIRDRFDSKFSLDQNVPSNFPDVTCLHPKLSMLDGKCKHGHKRKIGYFLHYRCGWNATESRRGTCRKYPKLNSSPIKVLLGGDTPSSDKYLQIKRSDVLFNNVNNFSKIVDFLCSSEYVLTSSYHGTLWATYLGKKVIIANKFSSKFDTLAVPVHGLKPRETLHKQFGEIPHPHGERQECARKSQVFFRQNVRPLMKNS